MADHLVPILGAFQHSDHLGYTVLIDADQNAAMDIIAAEDPVLLIHGSRNLMKIAVGDAANGQDLGGGFLVGIGNAAVMDEGRAMIIIAGTAAIIAAEGKISVRSTLIEKAR